MTNNGKSEIADPDMNHNKWMIYLVTVIAALGGVLFGYDTGVGLLPEK